MCLHRLKLGPLGGGPPLPPPRPRLFCAAEKREERQETNYQ